MPRPGVEFPITEYDRPGIAIANLMEGDGSAFTRALFSPMTLSPDELKTIKGKFLKAGGEKNKVVDTLTSIATNPFVLMGLIMALGPWGKVASPAQLSALWSKGSKLAGQIPEISVLMRPFVSPFTTFRNLRVHGFWDKLIEITAKTSKYWEEGTKAADDIFDGFQAATGRVMTKAEQNAIGAFARGWHTKHSPLALDWAGKGQILQDVPIAPGLQKGIMDMGGKPLMKAAQQLRQFYNKFGADAILGKDGKILPALQQAKVLAEQESKGVQWIKNYSPRLKGRTNIEAWVSGSLKNIRTRYEKLIDPISRSARSGSAKARTVGSLPDVEDLESIKHLIHPEQFKRLQSIEPAAIRDLEEKIYQIARSAQRKFTRQELTTKPAEQLLKELGKMSKGKGGFENLFGEELWHHLKSAGLAKEVKHKLSSELVRISLKEPTELRNFTRILAQKVGAPARFTMQEGFITKQYVKSMAPTAAWYKDGLGESAEAIIQSKGEAWQISMWNRDLRPMIRGHKNVKEYARSVFFKDAMIKGRIWLTHSPQAAKYIPSTIRTNMINTLSGARGALSDQTIGGKLASLFYTSALGMNASPISKNMLQPFITTGLVLKPENLLKGAEHVGSRITALPALAKKLGSMDDAIKQMFPSYYKHFGAENILQAMAKGDIGKEGAAITRAMGGFIEKGKQVLMTPFAGSEKWNRLLTFYSSEAAGVASGLGKEAASAFARDMTYYTQFPGGILGLPNILRGAWAPWRQFMHFPMRYMEFLYGSMRMGPDPTKLSLGVLGRGIAGSAATYEAAKGMLGLDVSSGLMLQALPGPTYEQSPFYPFPFVPPTAGVIGDAVKAIHSGDFSNLESTASLLVPGGLGFRRAYKALAPKYAGYNNRTPDGKIPIYNKQGALITTNTPMQLTMRALGIKSVSMEAEQQMTGYLLKQRDKIRGYRREYLEALSTNNLEKARSVNEDFQKQYPELGPLQLKKTDITAFNNRKQRSRMNRVLKGFPREYQPIFQQVMETAQVAEMGQDIDNNPSALPFYLDNPEP